MRVGSTQSLGSQSTPGVSVTCGRQRSSRKETGRVKLPRSSPRVWGAKPTIMVAFAPRKSPPELSDSLVHSPLWVSACVQSAHRDGCGIPLTQSWPTSCYYADATGAGVRLMVCSSSYTGCIRQRQTTGAAAEPHARHNVGANERRLPSGLGRSGQSAFAGLYRLSSHCWAATY